MHSDLRELTTFHRETPESPEAERAFTGALGRLVEAARAGRAVCLDLEALPRTQLNASLAAARTQGLLRELFAATDPFAAVTLYHLMRALPAGQERQVLGTHLEEVLCSGAGARMARLLAAMVIRERRLPPVAGLWRQISLCFAHDMLDESNQELALSLFAARELHDQWLTRPAAGSLSRRLLSARLLASAAYGAAGCAQRSDRAPLSLMSSPSQHTLRQRLLFDREPLVWRLAALARGWLATWSAHEAAAIEADLAPRLSPTEWRRAGLSLVAAGTMQSKGLLSRIERMHAEGLFASDRGLPAVMLHGLWGAADDAATRAVGLRLLDLAGPSAAPELAFLVSRNPHCSLLRHLATLQLDRLREPPPEATPWSEQQRRSRIRDLERVLGAAAADPTVDHAVRRALALFWERGPAEAFTEASHALTEADRLLDVLQSVDPADSNQVLRAIECVDDLQRGVLSDSTLTHLLALGPLGDRALSGISYFRERLTNLLMLTPRATLQGPLLDLQRERAIALIRVLDRDSARGGGRLDQSARVRALQVLLGKLHDPSHAPLRRPLCAAITRAVDGMVRAGEWEPADALLLAALELPDIECGRIMAEASMVPELVEALTSLHACLAGRREVPGQMRQELLRLQQSLPLVAGPRLQALRAAFTTLASALEEASPASLGDVAEALGSLELLALGLSAKLTGKPRRPPHAWPSLLKEARAQQGIPTDRPPSALEASLREAFTGPAGPWLTHLLPGVLGAVREDGDHHSSLRRLSHAEQLPHWLPATRELGDYIVLRAVGGGACGSVFVSRRRGQQLRRDAPTYALKVPEISHGTTTLSRTEFLEMFRAEAGAIASLPSHRNLAALESFDRSALPMPFLVMEHVQGPSLESVIAAGRIPHGRALAALLGVARGLAVMHTHGIGHLDVKPSNVILRPGDDGEEAVLVDFGLAGRRIRAGCGTHAYAAPEVFGGNADQANPCAADVYSFAVLAFEVLTGKPLFLGPTEFAYIAQHVSHDGEPERLNELSSEPALSRLSSLMRSMLRQDPDNRCDITTAVDVIAALVAPSAAPPLPRLPEARRVAGAVHGQGV